MLEAEVDPEQACRQLVAQANDEGGEENITAILARSDAVS